MFFQSIGEPLLRISTAGSISADVKPCPAFVVIAWFFRGSPWGSNTCSYVVLYRIQQD